MTAARRLIIIYDVILQKVHKVGKQNFTQGI